MQFANQQNILIIGQLNINYLSYKFESLVKQVTGNIDILMFSETKLDNTFPVSQFLIDGYTHNSGRGIMFFVREDIPYKLLSLENNPM